MNNVYFSFIIPVYNRPEEVEELLRSFSVMSSSVTFEIVVIEDGSTNDCKSVIDNFSSDLNVSYYKKKNSGPGDSRNFGMQNAKGNYFIILDSDVLLPKEYLNEVQKELDENYVDFFGGPDAAHASFSNLQKAINFSMTSFITTGGIRGREKQVSNFEPRSFNMGISKKAFKASEGFGLIHPGEDPDLSIRLKKLGYHSRLFPKAYVYHKRRISWLKFYNQVYKFGLVRPILNSWHPTTKSIVYWFPTVFSLGFIGSLILCLFGVFYPLVFYGLYFLIAFLASLSINKGLIVALLSVVAIIVQFFGYGYGFLKSTLFVSCLGTQPEKKFPNLFFNAKS